MSAEKQAFRTVTSDLAFHNIAKDGDLKSLKNAFEMIL